MNVLSSEQPPHYEPLVGNRDKYLFGFLFIGGDLLIIVAKLLVLPRWIPVAVASAALFSYAALVTKVERFKLREDRAGDNAYYLGFLFTLTSLVFALLAFETQGQNNVPAVIGNFALALVSTILGLAIRVWFQQLREDPIEFEHEARLALGRASERLRTELIGAVEDISVIRQRVAGELQQDFVNQAKQLATGTLAQIRAMSEGHVAWLSTTAAQLKDDREQVLSQAAEQKNAMSRLTKSLQTLVQKIETAELPTDALRRRFADLCVEMDNLMAGERARIEAQVQVITPIVALLGSINNVSAGLDATIKGLGSSAQAVAGAVTRTTGAVDQLNGVINNCSDVVKKSVEVNLGEVNRLASEAKSLSEEVGKAVRLLSADVAQSAKDVATVRRELVQSAELLTRELGGRRN